MDEKLWAKSMAIQIPSFRSKTLNFHKDTSFLKMFILKEKCNEVPA